MHTMLLLAVVASSYRGEGESGLLGVGDVMELGAVVGTYGTQGPPSTSTETPGAPTAIAATLLGVRFHIAGYTHRTLLGAGGGVEANLSAGYALSQNGFWWGQLDALANIGLINQAFGPVITRLHLLVGFSFSLWTGTALAGGARLALGIVPKILSLEGSYLIMPTANLTIAHKAQANIAIAPIQLALGAELNFGSAAAGAQHFSLIGTATWRPDLN